jgi:hypothetical protein
MDSVPCAKHEPQYCGVCWFHDVVQWFSPLGPHHVKSSARARAQCGVVTLCCRGAQMHQWQARGLAGGL